MVAPLGSTGSSSPQYGAIQTGNRPAPGIASPIEISEPQRGEKPEDRSPNLSVTAQEVEAKTNASTLVAYDHRGITTPLIEVRRRFNERV